MSGSGNGAEDAGTCREDLRISEAKFRALVENTNDVVFSTDSEGFVTYASPSLERMTGFHPSEVTGRHFSEVVHPDDLPALEASFRKTLLNILESFEFRIIDSAGGVLHVRTSSRPVMSDGVVLGVTGVMVDITERKRTEEELQKYREHLEELVQVRTADLARVNRTLKILTDCNQAIVRAVDEPSLLRLVCEVIVDAGYPLAWVGLAEEDGVVRVGGKAGRAVDFLDDAGIVWTDTERGRGPTGKAIRNGHPVIVQDSRVEPGLEPWRADALGRGFLSSLSLPITGETGVLGALTIYASTVEAFSESETGLLEDLAGDLSYGISNLRQREARSLAEKALRESEERYRGLFDMSPDAIAVHDGSRILFANTAAARLLGLPDPGTAVGMPIIDFVHPDSRVLIETRVRTMLSERLVAPLMEERFVKADGSPVDVETIAMPITWMGRPAVQVAFRDVSERKHAQAERERLQAQLAQAQKMELLGSLAGGLAHDFNNMLAVILGYAELMHRRIPAGDSLLGELEEIEKAARRSSELTRRLLAFARKQTITPRILDLNSTVESLLDMLRKLVGEGISLDWEPDGRLWAVKLDPVQVDQVLTNLCINARDAIAGIGRIVIRTANTEAPEGIPADAVPPGDYIRLSVRDDGCGMDDTVMAHLFEPFFTTKGLGQGTGLGLATVYGIVRQNGGYIGVSSAPGEGSEFRIYLPRETSGVPHRVETAVLRAGAGPAGGTVLLVEDEPGILSVCERILSDLGYSVLPAATPWRALELAGRHEGSLELLLTDVVMPEMSGPDLFRRLSKTRPDLRCLYMSGYSAEYISRQGVLGEAIHFVQKPFSVEGLSAAVRRALAGGG
jgi:PAS domain S-box-containing protein